MVYVQQYSEYREARKQELKLKAQKGGEGFWKIIGLVDPPPVGPAKGS